MADADRDGELSRHELAVAMHLAACVTGKGKATSLPLPRVLPACLAAVAPNNGGDDKGLPSTEGEEVIENAEEERELDRGASQKPIKGQQDVNGGDKSRLASADDRHDSEYQMNSLEKGLYDEAYDRLVNGTSTTLRGREVRTSSTGSRRLTAASYRGVGQTDCFPRNTMNYKLLNDQQYFVCFDWNESLLVRVPPPT